VSEIFKYLLYDRQQIPFPLSNSQSLRQLNDKSIAKQLSPKEELILVMIEDLDKVFNELICIMSLNEIRVDCVSLSLGQSLQMPKELYCIEMPAQHIYDHKHTTDCTQLTLRSAVTRFFRCILDDKNILFQNRKDIAITKMFVLIKVNKCYAKQVMDHEVKCHQTDQMGDHSEPLFTPHMDYKVPKFGNRFQLILKQKQCNCTPLSDKSFEILDETEAQEVDRNLDTELSEELSQVLSLNDNHTKESIVENNDDFIWIQIRSSIKGIQYNHNKSVYT